MESIFKSNVEDNLNNLVIWRNRYDKADYPEKIVLNIFYDLVPLPNLWRRLEPYFGQKLFENFEESFNKVAEEFRINQLTIRPTLISMLELGVKVGGLSSKSYDKLVLEAKNKSNKAIEELEFTYIVRVAIKAAFIDWFAFGQLGLSKPEATNRVFSVQYPIQDYKEFDAVFRSFAQNIVSEISGTSKPDGTILTPSLYTRLPDYW